MHHDRGERSVITSVIRPDLDKKSVYVNPYMVRLKDGVSVSDATRI